MKSKMPLAIALAAILSTLPAAADDTQPRKPAAEKGAQKDGPSEGSQQHKMKVCNVEAGKKNLKGDERRAFMSSCLKG